jgi:hypothetical protein
MKFMSLGRKDVIVINGDLNVLGTIILKEMGS